MTFISRLFGQTDLIYIHTDRQQYYAGELVSGQMILSVVHGLNVDGVFLKIYGNEEVEFDAARVKETKNSDGKKEYVHYTERVRASKTFFRRKYCIYSQKCTLTSGNFVFPFQFRLDAKLPGTFEIYNHKSFSQYATANITYRVEAEVAVPGLLTPNLRHSQDILICEPLRAVLMASDTYKETKVTFLCCIPKGNVSMTANIDKNAYAPGESVQLRLIIDNSQSRVDLDCLVLRLSSKISLHASGDEATCSGTVVKASSAGVKAGERADRFIQLSLPPDLEPSTSSDLISCEYVLNVILKIPWSPDVNIKQPVQIYAPQRPTYVGKLQYPQGWAPSVFPVADLQTMQYVTY